MKQQIIESRSRTCIDLEEVTEGYIATRSSRGTIYILNDRWHQTPSFAEWITLDGKGHGMFSDREEALRYVLGRDGELYRFDTQKEFLDWCVNSV